MPDIALLVLLHFQKKWKCYWIIGSGWLYQFSSIHELVDPLDRDLALDQEDDEHRQDVERDPQEVEQGQGHKGRVGVQHVVRVGQDVSGERSLE